MSDPLEFIPGYVSPLTDRQHAQIGRIAILWGQVEHFVEQLLPRITGLSWKELEALGVTEKPIGSKVNFLKAAASRITDDDLKNEVRALCAAIDDTKVARNHLFHGIWGWRGDKRTKNVFPAARKTSAPHAPLKATQLPYLEKKLCRCSRMAIDIIQLLENPPMRTKYTRFLHHGDKDVAPQWFRQWSERNPLDGAALDRTSKAGRLPFLSEPYPQK
jgi:hypothetical protein